MVSTNLVVSENRSYEPGPSYHRMDDSQTLALMLHDSVVDIYRENAPMGAQGFYKFIHDSLEGKIESVSAVDRDLLGEEVYGRDLDDIIADISGYYARNFEPGSSVETEIVLENNGLNGRADIVREVDGVTEIRDIKNNYTGRPFPTREEELGMGAYALLSRGERDIDRFVLEFPLQEEEKEIDPVDVFGDVVGLAEEFKDVLERARRQQASLIRNDLGIEGRGDDREFVEGVPRHVRGYYANWAADSVDV